MAPMDFPAAGIDHFNPGTVRDVEAMGPGPSATRDSPSRHRRPIFPLRNKVIWGPAPMEGAATANQRSDQLAPIGKALLTSQMGHDRSVLAQTAPGQVYE